MVSRVAFLIIYTFVESAFIPASYSAPPPTAAFQEHSHPDSQAGDQLFYTYIDYEAKSFAVFEGQDSTKPPVTLGQVEWVMGREKLVPTRRIEERSGLYVLTDPRDPAFLKVVEKLPGGGLGRLLRYRGTIDDGRQVDLEFVYEDRVNSLTILDYIAGRFFRTTFTEERPAPLGVFPSEDEKGLWQDLTAAPSSTLKFILRDRGITGWVLPQIPWVHSQFEGLSGQDIWSNHKVRGPPAEGITL